MDHVSVQDYKKLGVLRASAILTTSYVDGEILLCDTQNNSRSPVNMAEYNQLILYVKVTLGSLTDVRLKLEYSPDKQVTYYQETADSSPSSGVITESVVERKFTADGNYLLVVPIKYAEGKISVKGTGTVTSSAVAIEGAVGNS